MGKRGGYGALPKLRNEQLLIVNSDLSSKEISVYPPESSLSETFFGFGLSLGFRPSDFGFGKGLSALGLHMSKY